MWLLSNSGLLRTSHVRNRIENEKRPKRGLVGGRSKPVSGNKQKIHERTTRTSPPPYDYRTMILKEFECPFVGRDSPRFAVERRRKERFSTLFFFYTLACRRFHLTCWGTKEKRQIGVVFFSFTLRLLRTCTNTFFPTNTFRNWKKRSFFLFLYISALILPVRLVFFKAKRQTLSQRRKVTANEASNEAFESARHETGGHGAGGLVCSWSTPYKWGGIGLTFARTDVSCQSYSLHARYFFFSAVLHLRSPRYGYGIWFQYRVS